MTTAPIIFFAYNRPELARAALKSLQANKQSSQSILYIYADGAKPGAEEKALTQIMETRKVLREEKWCGEVHIIESPVNKGLADSVISGVTEVLNKHDNAIIIEDDVLLSPYFLDFMNDGLNMYSNDEKVFGIGGWTYFTDKMKSPFFLRYPDSIAWGIYKRSWKFFMHDAKKIKQQLNVKGLLNEFNPFEKQHYFDAMLDNQIEGKIDSWAIRWTASAVLHRGLFLYPHVAIVKHMGNETGTHEKGNDYNSELKLSDKKVSLVRQNIEESEAAFTEWKNFVLNNFIPAVAETSFTDSIKKAIPVSLKRLVKELITSKQKGVNSDDLLETEPVSRKFGFDRGTPIDRYYIEEFLTKNKTHIKGRVLEIADSHYSKKFDSGVSSFEVLSYTENTKATIVGDLTIQHTLPSSSIDCFICTQTLNFIYDVKGALQGAHHLLKPGGVLLVTVAGICQISQFDNKQWGDYWRFTPASVHRLASEVFGETAVKVSHYGNSYSAMLLLKGYAVEDAETGKLDEYDEDYPVTITLIATKQS